MKLLLIFLLPFFVFADDWDSKYSDVCKRDKWCPRLKASDGTWLRPKHEIIALLKNSDVQNEIKSASSKYGVDSVAVAAAIAAENSLNVGLKDPVQTFLASKMGITSVGWKDFTFGLGQISLPAAKEADAHMARIENRAPKSDAELTREIVDPMGSIRVVATIIRKVQDDYKEQGFDISKDPGVLTTLFNLGLSESRAKAAKKEGRLPQINYFGLFVEKYSPEIRTAAKIGSNTDSAVAKSTAPKSQTQGIAEVAPKKSESPTPPAAETAEKSNKNLVKASTVTRSVALISAPLLCDTTKYGQDVASETKSTSFGAPVAVLEKDESFAELSRTLDCKSNVWKLVKGTEDKVGWVPEEQLEKIKSTKLENKRSCVQSKAESRCKQNIEKAAGELGVDSKNSDGLVYLKPISSGKDDKISFKREDFKCGNNGNQPENATYTNSGMGGMGMVGTMGIWGGAGANAQKPPISPKEVKLKSDELIKFADKELGRMSKLLGIPQEQLSEPENPYSSVASTLESAKQSSKSCIKALTAENVLCIDPRLYSKEFQEKIAQIPYSKAPPVKEISQLTQEINETLYPPTQNSYGISNLILSTYTPDDEEINLVTTDEIKESIEDCQERVNELQKTIYAEQKVSQGSNNQNQQTAQVAMTGFGTYGGNGSTYGLHEIAKAATQGNSEQIKKRASEFITFAKFCHARMNLLNPNKKKNKLNCTQAPKHMMSGLQLFTKDVVAKLYQEAPSQLLTEINMAAPMFFPPDSLKDILGQPAASTASPLRSEDAKPSYCPNRTAEYIEDLIKNNPCIKRVYVPTKYLSNKLGGSDSKVIYRQFEDDGKYAVEFGDGSCK